MNKKQYLIDLDREIEGEKNMLKENVSSDWDFEEEDILTDVSDMVYNAEFNETENDAFSVGYIKGLEYAKLLINKKL